MRLAVEDAIKEFERRVEIITKAPRFDDTGGEEIAYRAAIAYLRDLSLDKP